MKYTPTAFVAKWLQRFQPNDEFKIVAADLQEFTQDTADSFGAGIVNVPLLNPLRTDYPQGFEVRWPYGGVSYNFYSINGGGPHPAPPDEGGDGHWGQIGRTPFATDLSLAYELGYMQYRLRTAPESIRPGVLYRLHGLWNSAPAPDVVEVEGGQNGFAALGTLVSDGTRQAVTVDVAAGIYSTNLGNGGPTTPELEATFGPGDADTATTTVGGKYAATYGTLTTVNVVTGTYTLNGGAGQQLTAPLTLAIRLPFTFSATSPVRGRALLSPSLMPKLFFSSGPVGPPVVITGPFLRYAGADLPSANGVNRWPNSGIGGSAYDAMPAANMVAPARVDSPKAGVSAVRFSIGDALDSGGVVDFTGDPSRTFLALIRLTDTTQTRPLFGWGVSQNADAGNILDMITGQYADYAPFFMLLSYDVVQCQVRTIISGWYLLSYALQATDPGTSREAHFTGYANTTKVLDVVKPNSNPLNSPLLLGSNYYFQFQGKGAPFDVAHVEVYTRALPDADLLVAGQQILDLYGLPY